MCLYAQLDLATPFIFIANAIGVSLCTLKTGYINECCEFDNEALDRYTILRSLAKAEPMWQ
jgi:hypothetical protein